MAVNQITGQTYIVVVIDQVDLDNRVAHVFDKTGSPMQVSFRQFPGGVTHVPAQGEKWTAKKLGYVWYIDQKLDSVDEHKFLVDNMGPGDTLVTATGALHLTASEILVNGRDIGATIQDSFTSLSAWTTATLSLLPSSPDSVQVFLNGLLVSPDLWTLVGVTLTFDSPMAAGALIVFYQTTATSF